MRVAFLGLVAVALFTTAAAAHPGHSGGRTHYHSGRAYSGHSGRYAHPGYYYGSGYRRSYDYPGSVTVPFNRGVIRVTSYGMGIGTPYFQGWVPFR